MPYPDPFPLLVSEPVTFGVYPVPKHNAVVLSCMDLRQIDELAAFLARDNLTNRYDHLITAGAALGVTHPSKANWGVTFFEHLGTAIKLHHPQDVYVVEHRNCGAYKVLLDKEFPNEVAGWDEEREVHKECATDLLAAIRGWYPSWRSGLPADEAHKLDVLGMPSQLGVHAFLMDLRGNVELLFSHPPVPPEKTPPAAEPAPPPAAEASQTPEPPPPAKKPAKPRKQKPKP